MDVFVRHIFATLTYSRDCTLQETWKKVSKDFNRYHQRFKRLHNSQIQYFRVIEEHKDGYPHVHVLLQFPDACIRCERSRYFNRILYQKWKSLWTSGHSDYQKPRGDSTRIIPYLMKYLLKNQTSKTIWKKLISNSTLSKESNQQESSDSNQSNTLDKDVDNSNLEVYPTHLNGVKLASWSRNFDWSLLSIGEQRITHKQQTLTTTHTKEPCPTRR